MDDGPKLFLVMSETQKTRNSDLEGSGKVFEKKKKKKKKNTTKNHKKHPQQKNPNQKFTRRTVQPWARLPFQVMESPFIEVSKPLLDKAIDLN